MTKYILCSKSLVPNNDPSNCLEVEDAVHEGAYKCNRSTADDRSVHRHRHGIRGTPSVMCFGCCFLDSELDSKNIVHEMSLITA